MEAGSGRARRKLQSGALGDSWELYNISKDRNESNNLASKEPERLAKMAEQWEDWYGSAKLSD